MPEIGPALILAAILGVFHTGLYLVIRGSGGLRLPLVAVAAILGAFAGQQLGARLGDPLMIGDFGLIWASVLSWLGIVLVAAAGMLSPSRGPRSTGGAR
ncbi:MAG TPA: hypothetical protein VMZ33_03205 [Candidatus Limnocylindrales bacterium]|nr:hypothetical protein [Candidatus Limnocylindrales bacterium]